MAGPSYYGVAGFPPPAFDDEDLEALSSARRSIPARSLPPVGGGGGGAGGRKRSRGVSFTTTSEEEGGGGASGNPGRLPMRRDIMRDLFGSDEEDRDSSASGGSSLSDLASEPRRRPQQQQRRRRPRLDGMSIDPDAPASPEAPRAPAGEGDEDDDAPPGPDEAIEVPAGREEDGGEEEDYEEPRPCMSPECETVLRELGAPDPPSECYGCTWARADVNSVPYEEYQNMVRLFAQKKGLSDRFELCRRLERTHGELIASKQNRFRRAGDPEIRAWKAATIYYHMYKGHTLEHGLRTTSRLHTLNDFITHASDYGAWVEVPIGVRRQGGRIVDRGQVVKVPTERGIKMFKALLSMEEGLYKSRAVHHASSGYGASGEEVYPLIETAGRKMHSINVENVYNLSVARGAGSAGQGGTVSGTTAAHRARTSGISRSRNL